MIKGIELIANERQIQLDKGYTVERDVLLYSSGDLQLTVAAGALMIMHYTDNFISISRPEGWDIAHWVELMQKPYVERLAIAGALIAAEIDRVNRKQLEP